MTRRSNRELITILRNVPCTPLELATADKIDELAKQVAGLEAELEKTKLANTKMAGVLEKIIAGIKKKDLFLKDVFLLEEARNVLKGAKDV